MEDEVHNAKMYIQKRVCKIFFFFENVFILLNMWIFFVKENFTLKL